MHVNGNGRLVPVGGGDVIPLLRDHVTMGRRESCDVCLQFPNVSGLHCELTYKQGYWFIQDLGSTNGIKVNGTRVQKRALSPDDTITIAKRTYRIEYTPPVGMHAMDELLEDVDDTIAQSLLEKAGLARPQSLPQLRNPNEAPKTRSQFKQVVDQAMKQTKEAAPKKSPNEPTK
ncbi:MAG: FHA domain-containing protein [Gemmataceae bacterium]|nr:FHA domain-containing protein [Gemmataceae bacterium]